VILLLESFFLTPTIKIVENRLIFNKVINVYKIVPVFGPLCMLSRTLVSYPDPIDDDAFIRY